MLISQQDLFNSLVSWVPALCQLFIYTSSRVISVEIRCDDFTSLAKIHSLFGLCCLLSVEPFTVAFKSLHHYCFLCLETSDLFSSPLLPGPRGLLPVPSASGLSNGSWSSLRAESTTVSPVSSTHLGTKSVYFVFAEGMEEWIRFLDIVRLKQIKMMSWRCSKHPLGFLFLPFSNTQHCAHPWVWFLFHPNGYFKCSWLIGHEQTHTTIKKH